MALLGNQTWVPCCCISKQPVSLPVGLQVPPTHVNSCNCPCHHLLPTFLLPMRMPAAMATAARMAFTPPCSITCEYEPAPGLACQSELLLVPRGPGRSLAITMIQMTNNSRVTAGSVLQALLSRPAQVPGMLKR